MTRQILVVAAHPDDEVLGCGGTIARHAAEGDSVSVLFMADGVGSRGDDTAFRSALRARREAACAAAEILGAKEPIFRDFPDNRMDSVPLLDVAKEIEKAAHELQPEIVYTHFEGDLNVDHRACHQAVMTAFRAFPGQSVREILTFEICSSTEWAFGTGARSFEPRRFVDIDGYLDRKIKALSLYDMEMRAAPHVRSIESLAALAQWRGSCVGLKAAEAFSVVRQVISNGVIREK